jgi:mono/diheme cytochrome c family protein/YHS domain-containing protein
MKGDDMKKYHLIGLAAVISVIISGSTCQKKPASVSSTRQEEITLGEKIFTEKECGKCHTTAESTVKPEMKAPDLASAFLANDTTFVKAHLQFIELSNMPPLDLTPDEIKALAKYVAHLHAKTKTDPNLKNPDGRCPVCGAPLKLANAKAEDLQSTYADKTYYFDCADCKRLFERDASWYAEHGYLSTRSN